MLVGKLQGRPLEKYRRPSERNIETGYRFGIALKKYENASIKGGYFINS